eukprot:1570304-Amphidinium_carterae.1
MLDTRMLVKSALSWEYIDMSSWVKEVIKAELIAMRDELQRGQNPSELKPSYLLKDCMRHA